MWYRAEAVMNRGKGVTPVPRLLACVAAAGAFACVVACSDGSSKPPASTESEPSSPPEPTPASTEVPPQLSPSDVPFRLSIDGWEEELGAKAQLNVVEGQRAVRLEITGTGYVDVLFLNVDFDGIEGSMGLHEVDLGLPDEAEIDSASASLGGQVYHSQSGHVEVTLSADGRIQGSFDVALALNPPGDSPMFELSDEVRPLSGDFAGTWNLFCQSHLPGHSSTFVEGGDYCEGVSFK